MKALGTKKILFTVYHSQTDGQIERMNQEIEVFLWHYINYQQNNWIKWLVVAEFQYNNKKHIVTKRTSFKLNFQRYSWKENLMVQTEFPKL